MKKFLTVLILAIIIAGAWWSLRPLLVDDVVEEAFPPSTEEKMEKDNPLDEHGMTQEEIDGMSEEDKMAMERKIVMEIAAEGDVVMEEKMPESQPEKQESEPTPPAPTTEPALTVSGNFQGADDFHKGSGSAKIFRQADGSHFLRFENFSVTNGPDLRVYLVGAASPDKSQVSGGLELAKLKGNKGSQNYVLPSDVDPNSFGSVVIYCKPFSVVFATANLN